jgi:hypothetical protein
MIRMITTGTIRLRRDLLAATKGTSPFLWNDRSPCPDVEQSVDVVGERIRRFDRSQHLMKEDVRQERSHEEKRGGARVLDADDAGGMGSTEVTRHDLQPAARWTVIVARIERHDERRVRLLVHAEHEVLGDRRPGERHPLFRHPAKDDTGIRRGIDILKVSDARGQLKVAVHRGVEEGLFGVEMAQDGRSSHAQLSGDIRQRGRREALLREDRACCLKDLIPVNEWRPAHL